MLVIGILVVLFGIIGLFAVPPLGIAVILIGALLMVPFARNRWMTATRCNHCGKKAKVNESGLCEDCQRTVQIEQEYKQASDKLEKIRKELSDQESFRAGIIQQAKLDMAAELNQMKEDASKELNVSLIVSRVQAARGELSRLEQTIAQKKDLIVQMDEEVLLQEFGLYRPKYDFASSDEYKQRLDVVRQKQKDMIKNSTAVTGNMSWTVNGSAAQGKKMVKDMQKLLLRAFNAECDDAIEHVKYNSFESAKKRITTSCESISKLGKMMSISISAFYLRAKLEELQLAFEYRQKKQAEKEEQKELRAQMREEARLQKEIEEERKKIAKEKSHYANALAKLSEQLSTAAENEKEALLEKKGELEAHISDLEKATQQIDYREANQRAGYVYIISNVGSFGKDVYKIGMTRRLDPMERIDELGDASVPFNFDVHAIIFSDDAPRLEAALHKAFEDRKLNMVNTRREFFHVTLEEIKEVVKKNYDKTAEFIEIPEAEQYRVSLKMRQQNQSEM